MPIPYLPGPTSAVSGAVDSPRLTDRMEIGDEWDEATPLPPFPTRRAPQSSALQPLRELGHRLKNSAIRPPPSTQKPDQPEPDNTHPHKTAQRHRKKKKRKSKSQSRLTYQCNYEQTILLLKKSDLDFKPHPRFGWLTLCRAANPTKSLFLRAHLYIYHRPRPPRQNTRTEPSSSASAAQPQPHPPPPRRPPKSPHDISQPASPQQAAQQPADFAFHASITPINTTKAPSGNSHPARSRFKRARQT
ncbi:hypothetical protein B0T19DRAFT_241239 [Cercophora scortea]|uniref:Uncharacterized protein n=1 Tax=Cercophora scortea TaxID=314031 RepID=A0AAE0M6L8_9PEZI|nr:hypothetical protein B0T19DRAFT_241239 [Cercophora scortea]